MIRRGVRVVKLVGVPEFPSNFDGGEMPAKAISFVRSRKLQIQLRRMPDRSVDAVQIIIRRRKGFRRAVRCELWKIWIGGRLRVEFAGTSVWIQTVKG